uniref:Reverse transcriptase zinc-binding domain-containing protein n=1 Tax=Lactuca sativa TaxID=4236 RepID=A0A9R1W3T8_LACSA|nr:hypothetical protein LSAT_V11C300108200 [Lactuca sativa]
MFSVAFTRAFIDKNMLLVDLPTRWIKLVPIKVNVFAWRLRLDKLTVRVNLEKKGLVIHFVSCPLCDNRVNCDVAIGILAHITRWWKFVALVFFSFNLL